MKKKLFMIFMAFTMVLAFAGCGSDEQDAETGGDVSMEAMEEETTTAAVEKEDPTGMQTIELENVQMQIPAGWVYDESESSDKEHVYAAEDGRTVFSIEAIQTGEELDGAGMGSATESYLSELGYRDIGYHDTTVGGSIEGKRISVDKGTNPSGMNQQIVTVGKDRIFTVISCQQSGDDFSDFDAALRTVRFQ